MEIFSQAHMIKHQ